MSMKSYYTIGYGVAGPGKLPQQQVWEDDDYDALLAGVVEEFPSISMHLSGGELGDKHWYMFVRRTVVRISPYEQLPTLSLLTRVESADIDELAAAHECYVPEDAQQTRGWHIIHEVR